MSASHLGYAFLFESIKGKFMSTQAAGSTSAHPPPMAEPARDALE